MDKIYISSCKIFISGLIRIVGKFVLHLTFHMF